LLNEHHLTKILCNNPKLDSTVEDGVRKYTFKPIYKIRTRKDLLNLIKDSQIKGEGGILLENVQESMTTDDFERIIKV
jgi:transcription initiation factor TFIIE subunit beta